MMLSVLSLQSCVSKLDLPDPVRPTQTTSYSVRGEGGPLQHKVLKHFGGKNIFNLHYFEKIGF